MEKIKSLLADAGTALAENDNIAKKGPFHRTLIAQQAALVLIVAELEAPAPAAEAATV
jgi:hypothetical protein